MAAMNRKQRRAAGGNKPGPRQLETRRGEPAVMLVELEGARNVGDDVAAEFQALGLGNPPILAVQNSDGSLSVYAPFAAPGGENLNDCMAIARGGELLAWAHGFDCETSQLVRRDTSTGESSPWVACSRRAAGGSFRFWDIA